MPVVYEIARHFNELPATVEVIVSFRGRKNIAMTAVAEDRLLLQVPPFMTPDLVDQYLNNHEDLVEKGLEGLRGLPSYLKPLRFFDGETHLYMGAPITLKLKVEPLARPQTYLAGHELWVRTRNDRPATIRHHLKQWYRNQARVYFSQRLQALLPLCPWVQKPPELSVRSLKRSWGIYRTSHRITLSLELLKLPPDLVDGVILHELCHALYPNHSPQFHALLESVLPNHRQQEKRLDDYRRLGTY